MNENDQAVTAVSVAMNPPILLIVLDLPKRLFFVKHYFAYGFDSSGNPEGIGGIKPMMMRNGIMGENKKHSNLRRG
jgi:hypothetical protein